MCQLKNHWMVELQLGLQVQGGGRSVPRVPRLRLPPLEFRCLVNGYPTKAKAVSFWLFIKMKKWQADFFEISKAFNLKWN